MNLDKIYLFAKEILLDETTTHDWQHALRVEKNALKISPTTCLKTDLEIIRASCWLHDTIDPKLSEKNQTTIPEIENVLDSAGATRMQVNRILYIIQNLSYSKNINEKRDLDLLGQIVQDADRLDAIGAIGIARAFYYGGSKQQQLYDNKLPRTEQSITVYNYRQQTSVVNHFYEKLLNLEQLMNTPTAQKIAKERTEIMKDFLDQLWQEIN